MWIGRKLSSEFILTELHTQQPPIQTGSTQSIKQDHSNKTIESELKVFAKYKETIIAVSYNS